MSLPWCQEGFDFQPDPETGAKLRRLTSAPCINNNIYCEQPYCSKDGTRFGFVRYGCTGPSAEAEFWIADIPTLRIARIEAAVGGIFTNAWSGMLHYTRGSDILRFCLDTLTKEIVATSPSLPRDVSGFSSVTPDMRYGITMTILPGPTIGLVQYDFEKASWDVIFQDPEIVNPHLQYNPVHGRQLLVQHNRGSRMDGAGTVTRNCDPKQGTTLFTLDMATGEKRPLPVGEPTTPGATGHECFVADTGRVAFTTGWNKDDGSLDKRFPQGNLFTARPGDEQPTVFEAPEHRFNHVCVSKCGSYFVCDSYGEGIPGPIALVIGNLETGKYRSLLRDCGASSGGAQFSHAHPYLTSDNRHVITNSDPQGIPHVCAVEVPEAFLASLG